MSPSLAIWSEFLPYSWVKGDLPRLAEHGLELFLAIPESRVGSPELKNLLKAAEVQGVKVGAWLLLSDDKGYWPNSHNVEHFTRLSHDFLDWLSREKIALPQIIVDLEPDLRWSAELKGLALQKSMVQLFKTLKQSRSQTRFLAATEGYNRLVQQMHQRGVEVMAVTYPLVIDDLAEGNTLLQELLHTPVSTVQWDKVSLMTYRSAFQELLAMKLSPHFVKDYLADACRFFDMPVCGALGVIGQVEKIEGSAGYRDPLELKRDLAAARATRVSEIHLFSLDGMHQSLTPGDWLRALSSEHELEKPFRKDKWVRKGIQLTRNRWLWATRSPDRL